MSRGFLLELAPSFGLFSGLSFIKWFKCKTQQKIVLQNQRAFLKTNFELLSFTFFFLLFLYRRSFLHSFLNVIYLGNKNQKKQVLSFTFFFLLVLLFYIIYIQITTCFIALYNLHSEHNVKNSPCVLLQVINYAEE